MGNDNSCVGRSDYNNEIFLKRKMLSLEEMNEFYISMFQNAKTKSDKKLLIRILNSRILSKNFTYNSFSNVVGDPLKYFENTYSIYIKDVFSFKTVSEQKRNYCYIAVDEQIYSNIIIILNNIRCNNCDEIQCKCNIRCNNCNEIQCKCNNNEKKEIT